MKSDWQSNKIFAHHIHVIIRFIYDIFNAIKFFAFSFFLLLFWWEGFSSWFRLLLFLFLSCFSFSLLFEFLLFCLNFQFLSFLFSFLFCLFFKSLRFLGFQHFLSLCFFGSKLNSFSLCCILLSSQFLGFFCLFSFFCLLFCFCFRNSVLLIFINSGWLWLLRNLFLLRFGFSWRRKFLDRFLSGRNNFFNRAFSWWRCFSFDSFSFVNALFLSFLSVFMFLDRHKIVRFNSCRTRGYRNVLVGNFFDRSRLLWSLSLLGQLKFFSTSFCLRFTVLFQTCWLFPFCFNIQILNCSCWVSIFLTRFWRLLFRPVLELNADMLRIV